MTRHIWPAIALAVGIGTSGVLAAERATFILTNGERVSGEVVFHTEARTNIRADKNEFNVKINSGVEMPIPFAQVVAIDFAGGTPRPDEISALPAEGHLITLRSGETRQGRLIDFVAGTTVKWRTITGQEQDIPMTDVRRVFLRVDRIREIYDIPAATASVPPAAPSSGGGNTPGSRRGNANNSTAVTVRGALPWTDTGISVRRGQALQFETTGQIYVTRTLATGAAGSGNPNGRYPEPSLPVGALIGKIGANGKPFAIGGNTGNIQMPAVGRLFLGINDDEFDDNSGSLTVSVIR